jgi:hypothetical protein
LTTQYDEGKALLEMDDKIVVYSGSLPRINDFGEGKMIELRDAVRKLEELVNTMDEKVCDIMWE